MLEAAAYQNETGQSELVLAYNSDGTLQRVLYCPVVRGPSDPTKSRYRELTLGSDRPQWSIMRYVINLHWQGQDVELVRNDGRLRLDGEAFHFHSDHFDLERAEVQPES